MVFNFTNASGIHILRGLETRLNTLKGYRMPMAPLCRFQTVWVKVSGSMVISKLTLCLLLVREFAAEA